MSSQAVGNFVSNVTGKNVALYSPRLMLLRAPDEKTIAFVSPPTIS